jgi:thymidine phosphorylase
MDAPAILAKVRDGEPLDREEIDYFAQGLADGKITDSQAAAFAMAVCLNGLSERERIDLTLAMRDTGKVQQWELPGPVLDKHSTGGVGDNVSLVLASALAVCGAYVPMISGRGLGHTGGTLDKLDAIPGYRTIVSEDELARVVGSTGCAIVGAGEGIAPADKRLYAIRDVTGTVESIDLITASILSKKLAAGLEGLVLDVKLGNGAFLTDPEQAEALARSLVDGANGAGCKTSALLTDMNEPLARAAGNALETKNAIELLTGAREDSRLREVTLALGGVLLELGGLVENAQAGEEKLAGVLEDGSAAERFAQMVSELGGPNDLVDNPDAHLPEAPCVCDLPAGGSGFLSTVDVRALGHAVVQLGGGRLKQDDELDLSVGLDRIARVGQPLEPDVPLLRIHARDRESAERVGDSIRNAFVLSEDPPEVSRLLGSRIDSNP